MIMLLIHTSPRCLEDPGVQRSTFNCINNFHRVGKYVFQIKRKLL